MSLPQWRQGFEAFGQASKMDYHLRHTSVKVIAMRADSRKRWEESNFWRELRAAGVQISLLSNPCSLSYVPDSATKRIAEIEVKARFSRHFWPKVEESPSSGAICVSHLRALNEALCHDPSVQLIVVLEEDVHETPNTLPLFISFLAHWHCHEWLQQTWYVPLTYDCLNGKHATMVQASSSYFSICKSEVSDCLKIVVHPQHPQTQSQRGTTSSKRIKYAFCGQGARANAYSPKFVETILEEPFDNYYDLHVLELVSREASARSDACARRHTAMLCQPYIFQVQPTVVERCRGSEKLKSQCVNDAEETACYICFEVPHGRGDGLEPRLNAFMLALLYASLHRLGVYVLWPVTAACPCKFEEILVFDADKSPFRTIPFVRVVHESVSGTWRHAINQRNWSKGFLSSMCLMSEGVENLLNFYRSQRSPRVSRMLGCVEEVASTFLSYWDVLRFNSVVEVHGRDYVSQFMPRACKHFAVDDVGFGARSAHIDTGVPCMCFSGFDMFFVDCPSFVFRIVFSNWLLL